ncbi:conserved Plasmodium protein, unknown function [Plasmodium berghei]|uniref:Uncharacterized protein n=2 Tax=Plasmodium berghei TaxID=5821 RepID=A0A509AQ85_PLABA|nr:conserved Plasmodium protein, unknown function [Plasmodium berghei ANKA]SCM24916.1 conserved Plasmodium protein, unknown function [Plasmodium berghei]SCN27206.1 conserved Plasmodium protein, unknown function [Plasmodium berghei]SCO61772.1 conserved Plasmodium protein, unknown function [Plasmodium berghei]SCO63630.1 conserved Plasmodium protein, unknown function [Plasmodium berghei]VUC57062.1 conserved Plasmodium protein, unknown function [Plasmodium berghei ANKA]|eukprot:XP_034422841.1 conserved Plasmodium protein, unknown function [Plasmodium berghei ANKA]
MAEDKLNLIKDYLNDLNMSSQNLCNINYYNSIPKLKKIRDINDHPILNCLRTKYNESKKHTPNENEQFKSIDFEGYSTNIESESSISLEQTHDYSSQLSEGEKDENRAKKKEKKKFHTNSEKPQKKKIIFSFKKKNETKDSNSSYIKNFEISDRNDDHFVESTNKIEKPLILNQINMSKFCNKNVSIPCSNVNYNKKGEEKTRNKMHIINDINRISNYDNNKYNKNNNKSPVYSHISESQFSSINNVAKNSKQIKKREKNKKTILKEAYSKNLKENNNIEESNNMENNFCRGIRTNEENKYITPNRLEIEDKHIKGINIKKMTNRQNTTFSNDHEKELFQYLIKEANKEIEKIIIKIEQKYKNETAYKINNIKKEYDEKFRELTKNETDIYMQNETILVKNRNNKEKIKSLENTNYILLKEIEKLKKYNEETNNNHFQKYENINKNELNTKKLKDKVQMMNKQIEEYEKKINMLNDDLNANYEKYFYFQNKCGHNEKVIQQNEEEMINLKKKLEISGKSKSEIELELRQLQDKNIKVERDINNLREELNKAKVNVSILKEKNNEEQRNSEYLISCYKVEEKKLKEDLENYKIKYAISENNKYSKTFEQKLKNLETTLKDVENEKSIYERTCLKYEKIEKNLREEIKDLKNELYDCKNKLHQVNKPIPPPIQTIMFNANPEYGLSQEKENEHNMDKVQEREEFKSDEILKEPDITEKINSIEKQLILLKLEKSAKESELIRCPKYGKRSEEIKKKACLEQKLAYINDKISILNKNLKLIKNKK